MEANHRRMLRVMAAKPTDVTREWSVYIVRCKDGSFYTGIAKDVNARIDCHNSGRGAAYTRARRPVRLLHREDELTRSEALVREARIKSLPRDRKETLAMNQEDNHPYPPIRNESLTGNGKTRRHGGRATPHEPAS